MSKIMKQSLWDLKLVYVMQHPSRLVHYEAIPMGFETHDLIFPVGQSPKIMKQSLWDLKRTPAGRR